MQCAIVIFSVEHLFFFLNTSLKSRHCFGAYVQVHSYIHMAVGVCVLRYLVQGVCFIIAFVCLIHMYWHLFEINMNTITDIVFTELAAQPRTIQRQRQRQRKKLTNNNNNNKSSIWTLTRPKSVSVRLVLRKLL